MHYAALGLCVCLFLSVCLAINYLLGLKVHSPCSVSISCLKDKGTRGLRRLKEGRNRPRLKGPIVVLTGQTDSLTLALFYSLLGVREADFRAEVRVPSTHWSQEPQPSRALDTGHTVIITVRIRNNRKCVLGTWGQERLPGGEKGGS